MAKFNEAIELALRWEGGFQDHPNDPGNYYGENGPLIGTNRGITPNTYASYYGHPPTVQDMLALTEAQAKDIYRYKFWNRIKGDLIQSQALANIILDGVINHGNGRGTKLLQQALNGLGESLAIDGAFGPLTLAATNRQEASRLHNAYKAARRDFYNDLARRKPSMAVFLPGWINRIESFPDLAYQVGHNPTVLNRLEDLTLASLPEFTGTRNQRRALIIGAALLVGFLVIGLIKF